MSDQIETPNLSKPFDKFGWRWATTGIASYLNEPECLKAVLDALLINKSGALNQTENFKDLIETIATNKYRIEQQKTKKLSKKSNPHDTKNIIENSANYWKNLGLLKTSGMNAEVSELGYKFATGKLSNSEFINYIINTYRIPSSIYEEDEIKDFEKYNIKFKPLKIIVDTLCFLERKSSDEAYITENELDKIIVPLSIENNENNIEIFAINLLNYRKNPTIYKDFPNCSNYTDNKGFRMLNEFLYFLQCFEVLESDNTSIRSDNKIYKLNSNNKDTPKLSFSNNIKGFNKIYFGPPGTGKSNSIMQELKKFNVKPENYSRIMFHPDYDYHSFVGGYKPFTDKDDENKIKYEFVPQVLINLYIKAWRKKEENFFLIIEEINRGNCSEIFGDIFQLLDRNSDYNVDPSYELKAYLEEKELELNKNIKEGAKKVKLLFDGKLEMPHNLSILASMNTSDQSLYPIDSAFKRRWEWEYIPIKFDCPDSDFLIKINENHYSWLSFLEKVNQCIYNVTKSEDKQMGNWFINAKKSNNIISKDVFINTVLFYLWNDIFKDEVFNSENIFIEKNDDGTRKRDISFNHFYNKSDQDKLLYHLLENILGLTPRLLNYRKNINE